MSYSSLKLSWYPIRLQLSSITIVSVSWTGSVFQMEPYSLSLRKAIKQAKRQYSDKVESQFTGSNTRRMWQGLQTITDYKKKTIPVADIDVLLPDKLNNFFAHFEDNTVPPTRPATKDWAFLLRGHRE